MKKRRSLVLLMLAITIAISLTGCTSRESETNEQSQPAPTFQLNTYDNKTSVSLKQFSGKPVVINFWSLS